MSTVLEYIELKPPTPPATWGGVHPAPVYYYSHKDKKEYLLVFPHYGNDPCIHKYDIANNSWSHNIGYDELKFEGHRLTIDHETNTLYAVGLGVFDEEIKSNLRMLRLFAVDPILESLYNFDIHHPLLQNYFPYFALLVFLEMFH